MRHHFSDGVRRSAVPAPGTPQRQVKCEVCGKLTSMRHAALHMATQDPDFDGFGQGNAAGTGCKVCNYSALTDLEMEFHREARHRGE